MDTIWQTFLFRLAEHAQWVFPALFATAVLGLGPIGRAFARRLSSPGAEREELNSLREQVAELQERLDYTERLLSQTARQVPPSSGPSVARPTDEGVRTPV